MICEDGPINLTGRGTRVDETTGANEEDTVDAPETFSDDLGPLEPILQDPEVSEILSLPEGTVKSRLHAISKRLGARLTNQPVAEQDGKL